MTSTVIYAGELRTVATHLQSGTVVETDAPLTIRERRPVLPSDLVATALGTCMVTIMGIKARDLQIDLRGMKVEIEKIMKAEPRRIGGINLTFHFPESLQLDKKQQTIFERAAHTCPVMESIHPDIETKVVFLWNEVPVNN